MSPSVEVDHQKALDRLERLRRSHGQVDIRNEGRLRDNPHRHTQAICAVISAVVEGFQNKKIVVLVEAELSGAKVRSRPEDIVLWIEEIGVLVVEVKSHSVSGIVRIDNNVPVVTYGGSPEGDKNLIDQPRSFAFKLKAELELASGDNAPLPAMYYCGWMPNVSLAEVASKGWELNSNRVWTNDMFKSELLVKTLREMQNITKGNGAPRELLPHFLQLFGCTSGLRTSHEPRPLNPGTLGALIDARVNQMRRLTTEQEQLAFSPFLLRSPKVIRGVAGSGKTIVLANAVADLLLRQFRQGHQQELEFAKQSLPKILVLCFNRALVPFLVNTINGCFDALKGNETWVCPMHRVKVVNIDKAAAGYEKKYGIPFEKGRSIEARVAKLIGSMGEQDRLFDHVLIDEGQDIELGWFPLIRSVIKQDLNDGPSLVVFYDEAQNIYGRKMPGTGDVPPWKELVGYPLNHRGLSTIMRIGHRNTNEILTFSFAMLLGSFAKADPQMATYANMAEFATLTIPDDPLMGHPNAGRPCVVKIGERHYGINFAANKEGPIPNVWIKKNREEVLSSLSREVLRQIRHSEVDPKDILVLAPTREGVAQICRALKSVRIPFRAAIKQDGDTHDPRDSQFFENGKVTVSTIKSAKGYTAHIVHLALVDELSHEPINAESAQRSRAEFHVACTRATLFLDVWGEACPLMAEAEVARDSCRNHHL